jgi:hypothetical protein
MSSLLADRLLAARRRLIVGRAAEIATFQAALSSQELPFHLLYLFGPGGVGKTTLLKEFTQVCSQAGYPVLYIDGRNVEPSPDTFINALHFASGVNPPESPLAQLASSSGHPVILIDTYETLSPLDDWFSNHFFPQLPENILVVLASRLPPSPGWRSDPGWQAVFRIMPLRNFSPGESRSYLLKREIPVEEHQAVLDFTHGHPLALSLVADVFAQRQGVHFQPQESPDIVKTLLEQFVQKVPSPAHRTALEACALVRTITEALLGEMLAIANTATGNQGVHDLFEWLRELSFIESGREGLFPHDLARESLIADLRWRNPDWYAELHRRARTYFVARLHQASGISQQQILMDYVYLHRDNPVVRPFFEWKTGGNLLTDGLRESDHPDILTMTTVHEGPESARLAAHWMVRQPENVLVMRDSEGQPAGYLSMVSLSKVVEADLQLDPAIKKAAEFLKKRAPLRPGEAATYFRFWMARDTYQEISPVQSLIVINLVRHYLMTPGLAYTFFPVGDAAFWAPLAAYANLEHIVEADFESDGRDYGVFGHDWRQEPPVTWLGVLAEREITFASPSAQPPKLSQPLVVLSQAEFTSAVHEALRSQSRPDGLLGNPLLNSRMVTDKTNAEAGDVERSEVLRSLVRSAAELLRSSPKETKLYRALYHTYFQPAPTQEAAAEILDLPFSTYRRHLKTGISRLVEILWQWEIGSIEK